jgi:endonuclease/exonuclease/phosphatase family metal-dependent hydrolase
MGASELRLLSVHLKAFCATGPLDPKDLDCEKLKAQLPALKGWIDGRTREKVPFAVLGDFNRALADQRDALLQEIEGEDPSSRPLRQVSPARLAMCNHSSHLEAVDHLLLGGPATTWMRPQSFREFTYAAADTSDHVKLSDHCPFTVELEPPKN